MNSCHNITMRFHKRKTSSAIVLPPGVFLYPRSPSDLIKSVWIAHADTQQKSSLRFSFPEVLM